MDLDGVLVDLGDLPAPNDHPARQRKRIEPTSIDFGFERATNGSAWAIGADKPNDRFAVRRVVWGRLLARAEKRPGETIRKALVLVERKVSRMRRPRLRKTKRAAP